MSESSKQGSSAVRFWVWAAIGLFAVGGLIVVRSVSNRVIDKAKQQDRRANRQASVAATREEAVAPKLLPLDVSRVAQFFNRRSFDPPKPQADWQKTDEVQKALKGITLATQSSNPDDLHSLLDIGGHASLIQQVAKLPTDQLPSLVRNLKHRWRFPLRFKSQDLAHLKFVDTPSRGCVALSYAEDASIIQRNAKWRVLWHLVLGGDDQWRLLDWCILDWGIKESTRNAELFGTHSTAERMQYAEWFSELSRFPTIEGTLRSRARGRFRDVKWAAAFSPEQQEDDRLPNWPPFLVVSGAQLSAVDKVRPMFQGELALRTGMCLEQANDLKLASDHYEKAAALNVPGACLKLAEYHKYAQRPREAIKYAEKYLKLLGSGHWIHWLLAESYMTIGNRELARQNYAAAMDLNPQSGLREYAELLDPDDVAELVKRINKTKDPDGSRESLEGILRAEANVRLADALLTAPWSQPLSKKKILEQVRAIWRTGRKVEAVKILKTQWKTAKRAEEKKKWLESLHLLVLSDQSKPQMQLLRVSPDARQAILSLLLYKIDLWKDVEGGKILTEYDSKHENDFLPAYAIAQLMYSHPRDVALQLKWLKRSYSRLTKKSPPTWRAKVKNALIQAAVNDGQEQYAFDLLNPKSEKEIMELADKCLENSDWKNLAATLSRYEMKHPGTATNGIGMYRARIDLAHGRFKETLDRLAKINSGDLPTNNYRRVNAEREAHIRLGSAAEYCRKLSSLNAIDALAHRLQSRRDFKQLKQILTVLQTKVAAAEKKMRKERQNPNSNSPIAKRWKNLAELLGKYLGKYQRGSRNYSEMVRWYESQETLPRNLGLRATDVVRSYLRTGDSDGAMVSANWIYKSTGDADGLLIAALATGNIDIVSPLCQTGEAYRATKYWRLANDPDIGHLIRANKYPSLSRLLVQRLTQPTLVCSWTHVLKKVPPELTADQLKANLKQLGEVERITPIESKRYSNQGMQVFVVQTKRQIYNVAIGRRPLFSIELYSHTKSMRSLQLALQPNQGWITIELHTESFSPELEDFNSDSMVSVANQLFLKDTIAVFAKDLAKSGCVAMSKELRKQIKGGARMRSMIGAMETGLHIEFVDRQTKDAPRRRYVHQFLNLKPGKQLHVAVSLGLYPATEVLWVAVDQIVTEGRNRYVVGRPATKSKSRPDLTANHRVSVELDDLRGYRVVDRK